MIILKQTKVILAFFVIFEKDKRMQNSAINTSIFMQFKNICLVKLCRLD